MMPGLCMSSFVVLKIIFELYMTIMFWKFVDKKYFWVRLIECICFVFILYSVPWWQHVDEVEY